VSTITNGTVTGWEHWGVDFHSGGGGHVGLRIVDVLAESNAHGIRCTGTCEVRGCQAIYNSGEGVTVGSDAQVLDCT